MNLFKDKNQINFLKPKTKANGLLWHKPGKHSKVLTLAVIIVCFSMVIVNFQAALTNVSADVLPIQVSLNHMNFGTVFPGEKFNKNFSVAYREEGDGVNYYIVQMIKPLPEATPPEGYEGGIRDYCQDNEEDYDRCYRNLCPYLTKISAEDEGDIEASAFVGPDDLTDIWTVYLSVPAVFGHVSQDHEGGVISEKGNYGCDISINLETPPEICTVDSPDFIALGLADIGEPISESIYAISGWSLENMPGNYGGCENGAVCDYRQILGEVGDDQCTEEDRDATVVMQAGLSTPIELKIRHLDGISLLDSFDVYINETLIGSFTDDTPVASEIWQETIFDISSFNFTGELTIRLHATDNIWEQCPTYGQVAIDWLELSGCGGQGGPDTYCGDGNVQQPNDALLLGKDGLGWEECDDGNNISNDGCSASCTNEGGGGGSRCGDGTKDPGEECDDGNKEDGDGCSSTCTDEGGGCVGNCGGGGGTFCGDYIKQTPNTNNFYEECDGPNSVPDGFTCTLGCLLVPNTIETTLAINKSIGEEWVNPGTENINYIITITNVDPVTAEDVVVEDILPDGLVYADISIQTRSWDFGDIEPLGVREINYLVNVSEDTDGGIYTNFAIVRASNADPQSAQADLEVREVGVKGIELTPTGFSVRELMILLLTLVVLASSVVILRKKYLT